MVEKGGKPIQYEFWTSPDQHQKEESPVIFKIRKGTLIYPFTGGSGILRSSLQAQKIEGKKVHGYQAFVSIDRIDLEQHTLERGDAYWSLPPKTYFGAPTKRAKQMIK